MPLMLTMARWYVLQLDLLDISIFTQNFSQDWHVDVSGRTLWSDDAGEDRQQRPISHFVREGQFFKCVGPN